MGDWSWRFSYYHEDEPTGKARGRNIRMVLSLRSTVQVTFSSVADADNCIRLWQGGLAQESVQDRFPPLTYLDKDYTDAQFPAEQFGNLIQEVWPGNVYDQTLYAYDAAVHFNRFADGVETLTLACMRDVRMDRPHLESPLTSVFREFQSGMAGLSL